jgi:hypothetical protein
MPATGDGLLQLLAARRTKRLASEYEAKSTCIRRRGSQGTAVIVHVNQCWLLIKDAVLADFRTLWHGSLQRPAVDSAIECGPSTVICGALSHAVDLVHTRECTTLKCSC